MSLKAYLRDKGMFLIVNLFLLLTFSAFLLFLNIKSEYVIIVILAWSMPITSLLIIEYWKRREYYTSTIELLNNLDKKFLLSELIHKPDFIDGEILYEILFDTNRDMHEFLKEYERKQIEYREYIETWVHEVKTPLASSKLIIDNNRNEITNSIMKFFNDSQKQAKEYNDALPEVENKFVANVDFDVKKNSDNILSILIKYYKYAGGAHGYYENVAYNIDIRNGNFLTIDNLFKEGSDYKNIINEEIRNQIEELIKLDEQNKGVYEFKSIEDKQKFYIQDDNIVVYFDLYDIAPYAAGIPEFIINVNKIDHILKPEYKEIFK